jgi:secreted trypsin-like serine protease
MEETTQGRDMRQMRTYLAVITVTLLIGCGGGGGGSDSCDTITGKITGGSSCSTEGTAVVAVIPVVSDGQGVRAAGVCTGTVVTSDDILTAAHCITDPLREGADGFVVVTGDGVYPVVRYQVNPEYRGIGSAFDTAMITVNRDMGIPAVPINVSDAVAEGEEITVYGYGRDEEGQTFLDLGRAAYKSGRMIVGVVARGLFAASFDDTGAAICQGDSGGPVIQVLNGVPSIVGVTSLTVQGCLEGSISGFVSMQIRGNVEFVRNYAGDVQLR